MTRVSGDTPHDLARRSGSAAGRHLHVDERHVGSLVARPVAIASSASPALPISTTSSSWASRSARAMRRAGSSSAMRTRIGSVAQAAGTTRRVGGSSDGHRGDATRQQPPAQAHEPFLRGSSRTVSRSARRVASAGRGRGSMSHRNIRAPRGTDLFVPLVAAGSGDADAHEQPRSRGGRASRGPGRLRRHRTRRPKLGGLRRHRSHAEDPWRRRDPAGAVGQAGRGVPHARPRTEGPDLQLHAGPEMGRLGDVPCLGGPGTHDVRADDRGFVDLHRDPGHPAGHVRNPRRVRAPALR